MNFKTEWPVAAIALRFPVAAAVVKSAASSHGQFGFLATLLAKFLAALAAFLPKFSEEISHPSAPILLFNTTLGYFLYIYYNHSSKNYSFFQFSC